MLAKDMLRCEALTIAEALDPMSMPNPQVLMMLSVAVVVHSRMLTGS